MSEGAPNERPGAQSRRRGRRGREAPDTQFRITSYLVPADYTLALEEVGHDRPGEIGIVGLKAVVVGVAEAVIGVRKEVPLDGCRSR